MKPADKSPVATAPHEPRASQSSRSEKPQRILDAAIAVIAETGYFQARVSDIADRAGVADGTIYLYFKNKEQMLMAAINSAFATFLANARAALEGVTDPRERLRTLAFLHLEGMGRNRNLAVVFQTELRQSAKFLRQFSQEQLIEYFDLIRETVRAGQKSGVFRADVSDKIVANCFFGALDEMVTSWILSERDYSLKGAAAPIVDLVLHGLNTPEVKP